MNYHPSLKALFLFCAGLSLLFPASAGTVPPSPSLVTVHNRQILLQRRLSDNSLANSIVFTINGLDWNPTPVGSSTAAWATFYAADIDIISGMNASVVRTYGPLPMNSTGMAVLDYCYTHHIYVIMDVGYSTSDTAIAGVVNYFKNHPALLMFEVGNEWNYNFGYGTFGTTIANSAPTVQHIAGVIKANDTAHPVTSSLGSAYDSTPFNDGVFTTCSNVDVWGFNTYLVSDASAAVTAAAAYSTKPYYFSEIGTDAFNETTMQEDQANQSKYCLLHWISVQSKSQLTINGGGFSGEVFFEFSDEWWKYSGGSSTVHDNGGGSGPFYDSFGNDEWWGWVDINRNARQVVTAFTTAWAGLNAIASPQTITFPAIATQVYPSAAPITLAATATSGLPVTFTLLSGPATLAGSSLTLTGTGTVVVQASQAGNSDYNAATSVSQSFTVAAPVGLATWTTNNSIADLTATPQRDGVPNLLKYLVDIDPTTTMTASDRNQLPTVGLDSTTTPGTRYLTLTYQQNALATGITVNFQTSTDLQTWTTITPDIARQISVNANGDPVVEKGVIVTGAPQFIRLDVTVP